MKAQDVALSADQEAVAIFDDNHYYKCITCLILLHYSSTCFIIPLGFEQINNFFFFDNPVQRTKLWNYNIHNMANILMVILSADLSKTKYFNDNEGL